MKKAGRGRSTRRQRKSSSNVRRYRYGDNSPELPGSLIRQPKHRIVMERWNLVAILNRFCRQAQGHPEFYFGEDKHWKLMYEQMPDDDQLYYVWMEEIK